MIRRSALGKGNKREGRIYKDEVGVNPRSVFVAIRMGSGVQ